ncbi:hypothetical protein SAMN02799630_02471 [Paenibacillus sp. UNCCL117]|uniref:hypothetical protein n=1 Tax=unclassified Paenibacillus TaxID=185978 RepID=UPI00088EA26A|nr:MULTISPECIES: hypothetical protein [unclassified Paenibacillus]SDC02771.1 hypothetical protein SAMN04488602_101140 [Paenibacillus sp. cl123]SFW36921.1 hypothetical protein SAMN02799630_02471 [Paenibacillus sp. UNCCL117]
MSVLIHRMQDHRVLKWALVLLFVVCGGYLLGKWSLEPGKIRLLIFLGLMLLALPLTVKHPRVLMFGMLIYLPFLGFFRRMLIPVSGWSSYDPLVIFVPVVVLMMGFFWMYRTYIGRQGIQKEDDTYLFKLVRWMIIIDLIQVVNPLQGSILTGFGGIMFYVVPLFWMVLSRLYMTEAWLKRIYGAICGIAVISSLYGLKQITYGFAEFERIWIQIAGYAALIVGDGSRAFSFFTNAAEYTTFLVVSVVILWVYLLRGNAVQRLCAVLIIPLLLYCIFMQSSRTPVILTSLSLAVMTVVHAKTTAGRVLSLLIMAGMLAGAFVGISRIESSNELIAHQVNGLTNPMDEEHSTAGIHVAMFVNGMLKGIVNPLGYGLGSTTLAGAKLSDTGDSSEVDLSNMMISTGIAGGLVYGLILLETLRRAFRMAQKHTTALIILGMLIATLGAWSNGGNYSVCALIWLSIGFLDKLTLTQGGIRQT